MNRSYPQHFPVIVENSNRGNSGAAHPNGSPSRQNQVSNALVTQQSSSDCSAPSQDERVLDCSDWIPTVGCAAVLEEVGHSDDQPNVGRLHFPSPMSSSTSKGVDGAITPKPAGITAGKSVNPTVRRKNMQKVEFLSVWDVIASPRHSVFVDAVAPINGHTLSDVDGQVLKYIHSNERISWLGVILDSSDLDDLEDLGKSLRTGGLDELAALRFPSRFAWVGPDEAKDFWQQILPVKASRILFTPMDMNYVYVQLTSGHILHAILEWDGEDVYDETLINSIFMQIIESQQVAQ